MPHHVDQVHYMPRNNSPSHTKSPARVSGKWASEIWDKWPEVLKMKISTKKKKWEKLSEAVWRKNNLHQSVLLDITLYYIMDERKETACHFNFGLYFFFIFILFLLFVVKWILHRTNNTYTCFTGIFVSIVDLMQELFLILPRWFPKHNRLNFLLLFSYIFLPLRFARLPFYVWFPLCAFVVGIKLCRNWPIEWDGRKWIWLHRAHSRYSFLSESI